MLDALAVHESAVLALEVLKRDLGVPVTTIRACRRESVAESIRTAQSRSRPTRLAPSDRSHSRRRETSRGPEAAMRAVSASRRGPRIRLKRVAESGDRADITRRPWRVAECRADFRHQVVQAGVGDKRPRPEALENLRLCHRLRPAIEKKLQKLQGSRRKRYDAPMAANHALPGIELAFTEDDTHSAHKKLGFREIFPRTSGS